MSNSSPPVPASCIIHGRRRRRGAGGPLIGTSRTPHPGWGARRAEAGHLAGALLGPGDPGIHSRPPGLRQVHRPRPRRARCSSRAHLDGGSGRRCGAGVADAGSPGTWRPQRLSPPPRAPWRPWASFTAGHAGPGTRAGGRRPRAWRSQAGGGGKSTCVTPREGAGGERVHARGGQRRCSCALPPGRFQSILNRPLVQKEDGGVAGASLQRSDPTRTRRTLAPTSHPQSLWARDCLDPLTPGIQTHPKRSR